MKLKVSNYLQALPLKDEQDVILYNSLCGNPVVASAGTLKFLELFHEPQEAEIAIQKGVSEEMLCLFQRNSFLVPEGVDERLKLKEIANSRADKIDDGKLVTYLRYFSAYCNAACSYCSIAHIDRQGHEKIIHMRAHYPWKIAKQTADKFLSLAQQHGHKLISIRFFGGEALLDWNTYRRVIEYVSAKTDRPEVKFYLNTNGTLITPEIAEFLKQYRVRTIVSLDGSKEVNDKFRVYPNGKGTYNHVMRGIGALRNAGVELHINVTLNRANVDCLREVVALAHQLGATDVGIDDLCFVDGDFNAFAVEVKRQAAVIIDAWQYGNEIGVPVRGSWTGFRSLPDYVGPVNYCAGNGEEICVDHQGKVFPCYGIPVSIGHIDRLEECFSHPVYQSMALRVTGNIPECSGCEIEGPCGGGCAADAFAATHDVARVAGNKCYLRRTIARELLTEWARSTKGGDFHGRCP